MVKCEYGWYDAYRHFVASMLLFVAVNVYYIAAILNSSNCSLKYVNLVEFLRIPIQPTSIP